MNEQNENFYLTSTPVKNLLLKFSIPCILAMLVSALYNIVDQIFIGNSVAGTAGIMATTLVFPFTVVALALAQLIGDGCAALFSISLGSKNEKNVKKCVGNSFILIFMVSVILVLIGFFFMGPILNLLGSSGYNEICQAFTKDYFTILLIGMPFYIFTSAVASIIRADGSPVYSMISTVIGAIINLILDPILIFGFDMGVKGAAIATIVGQIVSATLCFLYFKKPKLLKLTKESFQIEKSVILKVLQLGISSFITQISIAIITVVANNVVGTIGGVNATDAGGALGIVFKIFAIVLAFSLGVSVGGQPIIGYNYGAKQYKRVLETYKYILISNVVIGIVSFLLFEFAPRGIVNLFGGHASDIVFYQEYARLSFQIYLGGILLCCIQKSSCIFLQSINKPYKAMVLSLVRDVVLLVPGVCILGLCGDLYSMLWAGPVADVGSFIVTVIFVSMECSKIKKLSEMTQSVKNNTSHFVVTLGREFGSGGKYIGEELSKRFQIPCYDKELLSKVSETYSINEELLQSVDEKQKSSFWYSFATNYVFGKNTNPISAEDNLFLKQAKVIEDLAQKEDCIIIGRCADYILKGENVLRIFVSASSEKFKVERKVKFENLTEKEALKKIEEVDKERMEYYKHYTGRDWGNKNNYELCIDTSVVGVEETIQILEMYIKKRMEESRK